MVPSPGWDMPTPQTAWIFQRFIDRSSPPMCPAVRGPHIEYLGVGQELALRLLQSVGLHFSAFPSIWAYSLVNPVWD